MKKILFVFLLVLASCSANEKPALSEYEEKPVEELYQVAKDHLDAKRFIASARSFDEVERQHPYSSWATKAQLMSAYSFYQALKYDDAVLALDRYIELHPADDSVAYAHYLRALCYYEQITDVRRDQTVTELALYSLRDVIRRFPDTDYAKDAKLKIDLTNTNLAGQQMSIGRYYLERQFYNAAINRFRTVIDTYQTTVHIEEALYRLVESYVALGISAEAKKVASVLGYNYSGSKWYELAYKLLMKDNIILTEEDLFI